MQIFKKNEVYIETKSNNNEYQQVVSQLEEFDSTLFLQRVQKLALENNLILQSIKQEQNNIMIEISADFLKWFPFVVQLEKKEKYVQIHMLQTNKNGVKIGLIIHQKMNKTMPNIFLSNLSNPFYIKTINSEIKLDAIIGQYVIIDSLMLTIGQKYKGYTLYSIGKDHIILQNANEQIKVRLDNV